MCFSVAGSSWKYCGAPSPQPYFTGVGLRENRKHSLRERKRERKREIEGERERKRQRGREKERSNRRTERDREPQHGE